MTVIAWIVFGIIVGAIARLFVSGTQGMGLITTCVMGIIGSLVGGGIVWLVRGAPDGAFDPAGWIMSIIGATLVVWLYVRNAGRHTLGTGHGHPV